MTVVGEKVSTNPTVDDGGTDVVAVAEDTITAVMDASSTVDSILDSTKSLLDVMVVNDASNEG